jgi:hypothetical protein
VKAVKTVVALGVLVLLLGAPPAMSQVPDDRLIVPGQRIGKWTLSMTLGDFKQMHGSPSAPRRLSEFYPDIATDELWTHIWENLGINVITLGRDSPQILTIVARIADYRTERGISVGSTGEAVEAAYGRPTAVTGGGVSVYDEIGLAVRLTAGVTTFTIVFWPGNAKAIWKYQVTP